MVLIFPLYSKLPLSTHLPPPILQIKSPVLKLVNMSLSLEFIWFNHLTYWSGIRGTDFRGEETQVMEEFIQKTTTIEFSQENRIKHFKINMLDILKEIKMSIWPTKKNKKNKNFLKMFELGSGHSEARTHLLFLRSWVLFNRHIACSSWDSLWLSFCWACGRQDTWVSPACHQRTLPKWGWEQWCWTFEIHVTKPQNYLISFLDHFSYIL